jgi:hypothetical protein
MEAGLDPAVSPEPLHDHPQLVGQLPVLTRGRGHRKKLSGIILKEEKTKILINKGIKQRSRFVAF